MTSDSTTAPEGATTLTTKPLTPFRVHALAYKIAVQAYEQHRAICRPVDGDDPIQFAYEKAYGPLVEAMHDAGIAAVRCPASSVAELADKLTIFKDEDMANYEANEDLLEALIADARRLGGVA